MGKLVLVCAYACMHSVENIACGDLLRQKRYSCASGA
jgi:hypothetical protein